MTELICSKCGRLSPEVEAFKLAMMIRLVARRDYERLEKFRKLSSKQLCEFYELWRNPSVKGD